jgi:adenylate kinase family enzyme
VKKIAIIGSPGAGKSTLARKMANVLHINVFHLDSFYWKKNWQPITRTEITEIQKEIFSKEAWIIDGNFQSTMDMRIQAADTIIFLDFPSLTCLFQAIKRSIIYYNKTRPDMGEGCKEKFDLDFYKWIWSFRKANRPAILKKIQPIMTKKNVIILKSNNDVQLFLKEITLNNDF